MGFENAADSSRAYPVLKGLFKDLNELYRWLRTQSRLKENIRYSTVYRSTDYIEFSLKIMKQIYGRTLLKLQEQEYPVVCYKSTGNLIAEPFTELRLSKSVKPAANFPSNKKTLLKNRTSIQKSFHWLIKPNIRYPEQVGYALDKLTLDEKGKIKQLGCKSCFYIENLITSHVLEYEIYHVFTDLNKRYEIERSPDRILKNLPERQRIHSQCLNNNIALDGSGRSSQIGVQALFAYADGATYKIRMITRSNQVAVRPQLRQFIPSGNFEIFESHVDAERLEEQFNPMASLYRELLEEVFGDPTLRHNESNYSTHQKVWADPTFKIIQNLLLQGKAQIRFLGTVFDLLVLRHELSFLIIIDDTSELEETLRKATTFEGENIDIEYKDLEKMLSKHGLSLNPPSAGLLKMAMEEKIFEKVMGKKNSG